MRYSRFSTLANIVNLWWFNVSIISPIQSIVDLLLLHVVWIIVLNGENSCLPGVSSNLEAIFFWKSGLRLTKTDGIWKRGFWPPLFVAMVEARPVRSTFCRSRKRVEDGLPSSTAMGPGTWISLSPRSCQRFLRHRMPEMPAEIQTLWQKTNFASFLSLSSDIHHPPVLVSTLVLQTSKLDNDMHMWRHKNSIETRLQSK